MGDHERGGLDAKTMKFHSTESKTVCADRDILSSGKVFIFGGYVIKRL